VKPPAILTVRDFGGNAEFLLTWAAKRIPHVDSFGGDSVPLAVVKGTGAHDARLLAVVVFNSFDVRAKTVQISCASDSPMWAHPETIRELLRIPFEQYGCFMVWMAIPHTNEPALRFNKGIGMKMAGPVRHMFGEGSHAVHMSMTRHEWARRWKERNDGHALKGRVVGASAA
jgi:hypothetical protein